MSGTRSTKTRKAPSNGPRARVQGQDALAVRASKKLVNEESLMTKLGPVRLKMVLDRYLWSNVDYLNSRKLWEYFLILSLFTTPEG